MRLDQALKWQGLVATGGEAKLRIQGGEDGGTSTPVAGETSDEDMNEEEKEIEMDEKDEEANMEEDKAEDTEMTLLENESPLESLFRLSAEVSKEAEAKRWPKRKSHCQRQTVRMTKMVYVL